MNREKIALENGYILKSDGTVLNNNKLIKCCKAKGYKYFRISFNKNRFQVFVHRLQAYIKYGDKIYNSGIVVRHLDGNPLNNSIDNIEIGTSQDNQLDIPKEKRMLRSSIHIKYSDNIVKEIKYKKANGYTYNQLMQEYNISSKGTLFNILNNR